MRWLCAALCLVGAVGFAISDAADTMVSPAKTANGALISPKGQSDDVREGKLTNQPARYYIWVDPQGWHFRSAAKKGVLVKFEGVIELSDGEFGRLRPIGLETKGKNPDIWTVDAARRKIEFKIFTSGSYDGFDFTIAKVKDVQVSFDLKIGEKPAPGRIFIGKDNRHPTEVPFSLSEEPRTK
jgi:hypothetical protein